MTASFDYQASAELFPGRGRNYGVSYKRFETAAAAIRFAIEDLDTKLLSGAVLEVNEERFSEAGIRALYASSEYPLARPTTEHQSESVPPTEQ